MVEEIVDIKEHKLKWYFRISFIITVFLCVGPLALPLVWFHPRASTKTKVIVTLVTLVATYYLSVMVATSLKSLKEYYGILSESNL